MKRLEALLICICLSVTLGLFSYTNSAIQKAGNDQFQLMVEDNVESVQSRMTLYVQNLHGAGAVLTSASEMSQSDFAAYVAALEIDTFLPGINGVGFIFPFNADEETKFYDRLERIGETRLTIKPETDGPERFVIERIEPYSANKEALGLDISFEEGRRQAAQRARDTGLPQLTPRILLVQDATHQPGFLLLSPLFERTLDPTSQELVSGKFMGWVYAPFVGGNLLQDLTPNQGRSYDFAVYDGDTANDDLLIFQTDDMQNRSSRFFQQRQIELYGRTWTIAHASTAAFESGFGRAVPFWILLTGLVLTAMLGVTLRNQRVRAAALRELAELKDRQIRAQEQENRAIVDNAVTPVFILAGDRRILFSNQAAQATFGYSTAELRHMTFDRLIATTPSGEGAQEYNATGRTKRGELCFLDVQCNDWLTHDGNTRTTAIVRDMSSEIEAVAEVERNRWIFDQALSGSRIGVFDVDLVKQTSEVSDTWCEIMGYEDACKKEDTQQLLFARIHPEDVAAFREADEKCIQGETPRSISEYRVRFPGGEWRWMRSDAVIVEKDENGEAVRMIGTQSDVTDLRHAHNQLEQSEQRFRSVVSAAPIGMAIMSPDGAFLDVNDALCVLLGYDETYLLENARLKDLMPAADYAALYGELMPMVEEEPDGIYRAEHRFRHKTGDEKWGLVNISWTYDKNQRRNIYIAQINDITAQKEIEEVKNAFVSTVSHELRTPLTSIKGALGLIHAAESKDMSDVSKRLIEIAQSNTDRLAAIVNDILDLEKISSGDVEFDFAPMDMQALVKRTIREMAPFAQTHDNTIKTVVPDGPLVVFADESRTGQVLANLISNACKYSSPGSEVIVRLEQNDGHIWTYIENEGPGVPDSFKPEIFTAFSQADSSATRAKGGTGLGLNIARQIVTRHLGQIGFESTPDAKTVFWFRYPMSGQTPNEDMVDQAPVAQNDAFKRMVLHLEDDVDFAEVVRSSLGHLAEVYHVTSIAKARRAIADPNKRFDVAIVDWSLADGDAGILLDEMFAAHEGLRVLGLSADADRAKEGRVEANFVKTRANFDAIAAFVCGKEAGMKSKRRDMGAAAS